MPASPQRAESRDRCDRPAGCLAPSSARRQGGAKTYGGCRSMRRHSKSFYCFFMFFFHAIPQQIWLVVSRCLALLNKWGSRSSSLVHVESRELWGSDASSPQTVNEVNVSHYRSFCISFHFSIIFSNFK